MMLRAFAGFVDSDFDAYAPERATSNVHVRPRIAVKEKLTYLARDLAAAAGAMGVALDVDVSDERPSIRNRKSVTEQWASLFRDRESRAELEKAFAPDGSLRAGVFEPPPFERHASILLRLDARGFDMEFRVPSAAVADVRTLRARLASESPGDAVAAAFTGLPNEIVASVGGAGAVSADSLSPQAWREFLDRAEHERSYLALTRHVPRAEAVASGASLGPTLESTFDALLPVYRISAWRRDDDVARVTDDIARGLAAHDAQIAEGAAREVEWFARHRADIERRRSIALADALERGTSPQRGTTAHGPRPARTAAPATPAVRAPTEVPVNYRADRSGSITAGAKVRVEAGPLQGKIGTVIALEPKGQLRIAVGLWTSRVDTSAVVAVVAES